MRKKCNDKALRRTVAVTTVVMFVFYATSILSHFLL